MSTRLTDTDVVIVGAGVVGCAIAARLASHFRVTVIEQHNSVARETSGRNSGVIHSGIHLPPTSNKAQLARRGKNLLASYCQRHHLEYVPVGMHIVVPKQGFMHLSGELPRLVQMLNRAKEQGIRVVWHTGRTIRRREPSIDALLGLYLPDVAIVDAVALTRQLHDEAIAANATMRFDETVVGIASTATGWQVTTSTGTVTAKAIINAAGLYADQIARLAGFQYRQYFYRGEYFQILPRSGLTLNGLVYPVHRPGKPGLGVHLTRTVSGHMLIGPNAKRVEGPHDYLLNPTPAEQFYADVKPFMPGLDLAHLAPHPAGIRPKLTDSPGENDFLIVWEPGAAPFLNLIGIESPGLTAALALAADANDTLLHRLSPIS